MLSHSILAHLPHFLVGMVAALFFAATHRTDEAGQTRRSLLSDVLFWLALAGIVIILGVPAQDAHWRIPRGVADDARMLGRYNYPYVPLLIGVLLVTAPQAKITTALLQFRPLRSIGIISYGVYVYHLPCLSFVNKLMTKANMPVSEHWIFFGTTGLALALVVALASYALIERPLLKWSKRRSRHQASDQPPEA